MTAPGTGPTPKPPPPSAPPKPPPPSKHAPAAASAGPINIGQAKPTAPCPRIVLATVEGWGKTTCGAYAPNPFMCMVRGETGYATLLGAGTVPAVDTMMDDDNMPRSVDTWFDLLSVVDHLANNDTGHKTFVLDALGGAERLCHEFVCNRDFDGDWGEKGFASYQKGFDISVGEWLKLLAGFDRLHRKGIIVLLLSHVMVRPFKNPVAADFDRYVSDVHHKTWGPTAKWADACLFGTYITVVDKVVKGKQRDKGKGIGDNTRILYTERRDTWDAKNRYQMPEEIDIPNDATAVWSTIYGAMIRKEQ